MSGTSASTRSLIEFLGNQSDLKHKHTWCTLFGGSMHTMCRLFLGACTLFSDIENPTFSTEFYKLPPDYS